MFGETAMIQRHPFLRCGGVPLEPPTGQPPAARGLHPAGPIAQHAVIPDLHEPLGRDVEEKTPDEFVGRQDHELCASADDGLKTAPRQARSLSLSKTSIKKYFHSNRV